MGQLGALAAEVAKKKADAGGATDQPPAKTTYKLGEGTGPAERALTPALPGEPTDPVARAAYRRKRKVGKPVARSAGAR